MRVLVALMVGLKSLQRQRLRTVLTMLGIVIGVAAVIAISAIGVGAQQAIEDRIESGGANMLIVLAGNRTIGGVRLGIGASSRLTAEDADAIRALPNVAYVSPGLRMRGQIVASGQNWNTSIEGAGTEMPQIHDWQLEAGTFFTARDVQNAEKYAVLGSMVRDTLFGPGVNGLTPSSSPSSCRSRLAWSSASIRRRKHRASIRSTPSGSSDPAVLESVQMTPRATAVCKLRGISTSLSKSACPCGVSVSGIRRPRWSGAARHAGFA
jgi:hypothetical protein